MNGEAKRKYKILCITRKYPPSVGGMEKFCYEVFNGLNADDFDKKIIYLGKSQKHLLWFFPYTLLYILLYARKYDGVFVGDMVLCFLGRLCKKVAPSTKRVVAVHGLDLTFINPLYQFYLKLFAKNSFDYYACNSHATLEVLESFDIENGTVIPAGLDLNKYKDVIRDKKGFKDSIKIKEDTLLMITSGRLVKRKGVLWFVSNVMECLKKENICYCIIGDGPDWKEINEIVKANNLEACVRVLGRISDDLLNEYYCNSDVFLMPNIKVEHDMEGFGLVSLEAGLGGCLVLASNLEGIKDAILEDKNGYLLESGNIEAYADFIKDILKNIEYYEKRAIEFSKYTVDHFSWDKVVKKYSKLFIN